MQRKETQERLVIQDNSTTYVIFIRFANFEVQCARGSAALSGSQPQQGVHFQKPQSLRPYSGLAHVLPVSTKIKERKENKDTEGKGRSGKKESKMKETTTVLGQIDGSIFRQILPNGTRIIRSFISKSQQMQDFSYKAPLQIIQHTHKYKTMDF